MRDEENEIYFSLLLCPVSLLHLWFDIRPRCSSLLCSAASCCLTIILFVGCSSSALFFFIYLFVCSLIDFLCYSIHRCSSFTCMDVSMEMLRRTRNLLEKMENAKDRIHPVKYVHLKGASPNEIPSKFNSK